MRDREPHLELTPRDAKRAMRQALLADRPQLMASQPASAPLAVRDHYLAAFAPAPGTVVSAFWPMPGELDLRPLLEALHARGCVCALPVVVAPRTPLVFRSWAPGVELVRSRFGIAEPGPDQPIVRPRHALVPLLAYDDEGFRLGYGGGFYDLTLSGLRADRTEPFLAIGAALAAQRHAELPRETFDERLDALVTDGGVVRF